jgi:HAE1 family hydrophobic/amphiphilic exporter-1
MLNVPLANVFQTLQVNLGSAYANDFNFLGRVNQVLVQASENFRLEREDILRLKTRSTTGALVPLGSLVNIRDTAGPDLVQRYNMFTAVPIQGDECPRVRRSPRWSGLHKSFRKA